MNSWQSILRLGGHTKYKGEVKQYFFHKGFFD
jgi:hypothetical protein